jgi:chemotaxis protein CheZ
MSDNEVLRHDLIEMVDELRATLKEIGEGPLQQTQLVTNTRDRLRYIVSLTEQAASQTLNAAESIGDNLRAQSSEAAALMKLTRSPRLRAFLERVQREHAEAGDQLCEVIQAQAFQDLVGQVINKLLNTVQKLEDNLAHLLVEDEPEGPLEGPQVRKEAQVSQDDIDSLFG